jgi:tetratricopeptide (TPR) repeat protein
VTAALALLLWGTVDQVRYYLALHSNDLRDLQRAAALDSFDASLQLRLAASEMDNGHPKEAESALRTALYANPADPAPRHALLRYLIEQKRFDEAYLLTEASLRYAPKDADMLVDRGILALQLGRPQDAIANWRDALAADPGQINANLYLADELDREKKPADAVPYYAHFLENIARQGRENRPQPRQTIAIILRMADCQIRASQPEAAIRSYRMARKLAAQTRESRLESVADTSEAALQKQAGKLDEALQLYQRALQLDDSAGDRRSAADDWFTYGQFLEAGGFPPRLAYTCFLKSESLTRSLSENAISPVLTDAIKKTAKEIGTEAAELRRNPAPAVEEALALRRPAQNGGDVRRP